MTCLHQSNLLPFIVAAVDYESMPVNEIMEPDLVDKLMEYSLMSPQPMSIEEIIEFGDRSLYTEEASFTFLKKEMAIRIAHMIMELQRLPKDLHEEEVCMKTMEKYSTTFKEVIGLQDMEYGAFR